MGRYLHPAPPPGTSTPTPFAREAGIAETGPAPLSVYKQSVIVDCELRFRSLRRMEPALRSEGERLASSSPSESEPQSILRTTWIG